MRKVLNGYNCLVNCVFASRRVNSPHAGFYHLSCYNVRKAPGGVEGKGLFTREASAGRNLHDCCPVFSWLGNNIGNDRKRLMGPLSQQSTMGGKWAKAEFLFMFSRCCHIVGEKVMRVGIQMSVLLNVRPSPSPTLPLRTVVCGRPSRETRERVVRGVVQSY